MGSGQEIVVKVGIVGQVGGNVVEDIVVFLYVVVVRVERVEDKVGHVGQGEHVVVVKVVEVDEKVGQGEHVVGRDVVDLVVEVEVIEGVGNLVDGEGQGEHVGQT